MDISSAKMVATCVNQDTLNERLAWGNGIIGRARDYYRDIMV